MIHPYLVCREKLGGTVILSTEYFEPSDAPEDAPGFVAVPMEILGPGRISIAPEYMQRLRVFLGAPSADDAPAVRP